MAGDNELIFKLVDGGSDVSEPRSRPEVVRSEPPTSDRAAPESSSLGGMRAEDRPRTGPGRVEISPPESVPHKEQLPNISHASLADYRSAAPPAGRNVYGGTEGAFAATQRGELGAGALAPGVGAAAGAALGGVAAAAGLVVKGFEIAAKASQDFAGIGMKLAANRNADALLGMASAATKSVPVLGQLVESSSQVVKAFEGVVDGFVKRGLQLSPYSGELTEAKVQSQVRAMQADIKEAHELGPDLARLIAGESEISTMIREMLLPIKQWLVGVLADLLEAILAAINEIKGIFAGASKGISQSGEVLDNFFTLHWPTAFEKLVDMPSDIVNAYEQAKRKEKAESQAGLAVDQLWRLYNQVPGANRPPEGRMIDLLNRMKGATPSFGFSGSGGDFGGGNDGGAGDDF